MAQPQAPVLSRSAAEPRQQANLIKVVWHEQVSICGGLINCDQRVLAYLSNVHQVVVDKILLHLECNFHSLQQAPKQHYLTEPLSCVNCALKGM